MSGRGAAPAAVAVLVGIAALGWFAIVTPLAAWKSGALAERAETLEEIARLEQSLASLKAERGQLSVGGELDVLWTAAQMGEATARVQSELSGMARANGVSLRSISPNRARDMTLANAAGVRLEMEAGLDQLGAFLTELEHHSPALLIERAVVRRLNKPSGEGAQPLVFAQIDVSAPIGLSEGGQP